MIVKIPFWWKVGGVAFGFLSFIAGVGGTYIYAIKYGENKCRIEQEKNNLKEENELFENAIKNLQDSISDIQRREDKIRNSPLPNPPLGDNMRASLDRLRCERDKDNGASCP